MWWGGEGGGVLPGCGGEVRAVECYLGVVGR